jgi:hypothetical protein
MSKWGKIHDSWLCNAITEKSCKSWQQLVDAFNLSFPDYTNPPNEDVLAFRWQVSNRWKELGASYKDPFTINKIAQPITAPAQPITESAQVTNRSYRAWTGEEDKWLLGVTEKVLQARPDRWGREEWQAGWILEQSLGWEIIAADYRE